MALTLKLKQIVNSGIPQGGHYYFKASHVGTISQNNAAKLVQENCTVKISDCKAVIAELVEVITKYVQLGYKVKLDGLGTFCLGVKSSTVENKDDANISEMVRGVHVNFTPDHTVSYTGSTRTSRQTMTEGVTFVRASDYIEGVNDKDLTGQED